MAIKIKFDADYNAQEPTFVLCTRNGTQIAPIPARNIQYTAQLNGSDQSIFIVDEYDNEVRYPYWDSIQDFKLALAKEWNEFFEINVELSEKNDRTKTITCTSLGEAELSVLYLYNVEINTEDDISRDDYVQTIFYNEDNHQGSLLHRIKEKAPHYIIEHVDTSLKGIQRTFSFDNVSIYDALQQIAEEIDCIFILSVGLDSEGNMVRSISAYDLESYCLACGKRGEFLTSCSECGSTDIVTGYGDDTNIYVSAENLAEGITYTTDTGSVKNAFRLVAGDDLMTATIANLNPSGDGYIWYISDDVKFDMTPELVTKINNYDELYNFYNTEYPTTFEDVSAAVINTSGATLPIDILNSYNGLISTYGSLASEIDIDLNAIKSSIAGYPELMLYFYDTIDLQLFLRDTMIPSSSLLSNTTAQQEAGKLTSQNLSPVSEQSLSTSVNVANSAVLSIAKILVDSRYQVKVTSSTLDDTEYTDENGVPYYVWTGSFSVINYSDEDDTACVDDVSIKITGLYADYVKQRMEKAMAATKPSDDATNIVALFSLPLSDDSSTTDTFNAEISRYCLNSLNIFHDACQSCMDVLIEQGIADPNSEAELYNSLYLPYYQKLHCIETEIKKRESEIEVITGKYDSDGLLIADGMQTLISKVRAFIQNELNFETYLDESLWLEFSAYRREDTYENENYISDGLNNSELFENALEFIEVARKEIYKSATQQHSISGSLHNLLVMEEFQPIANGFELGNWLRVGVDNKVYRLRMIGYTIDFGNLGVLDVTFSDVQKTQNGYTDMESVLKQASSMAQSYNTVARQAGQAQKSKDFLDNWVENGLQLTQTKIIDSADNQNITIDKSGLWCKQYSDITDDYDDCELRLLATGLYLTNDSWKTASAGIGKFSYYSPRTHEYVEDYGVIAKTLIGDLILSEAVGIYNSSNSISLDNNGFSMTINADLEGSSNTIFNIEKRIVDADGNESTSPIIYVNENGDLVLHGSMLVESTNNSGATRTLDNLFDTEQIEDDILEQVKNIYGGIDGKKGVIESTYNAIIEETERNLNNYKAEVGQWLTFDENGLTIGATDSSGISSPFKTVLDNERLAFLENDSTVAYINGKQLYINNAVINEAFVIGRFFFCPRADGSMSISWQEE